MSPKLHKASLISVAATIAITLFSAEGSGAAAQASVATDQPAAAKAEPQTQFTAAPVVQTLPAPRESAPALEAAPVSASSLIRLVAQQAQPAELPRELACLAGAVYFEAKGESLPGQLAVGRVIVARSKSGRFPDSYCGVVFQPSQFSFVRGSTMPGIDKRSANWRNAVAIAQIAHSGSWQSPVEGALFFHAARVSPGWHLKRLAQVDNHIFYR
ncbi:MAG: cell wall hydrolase [Sphingomonadales bacterium]|nr:cell wall hydrolase [Sphingomonadales bacterium]